MNIQVWAANIPDPVSEALAPLAVFHPDGKAERVLVIGKGWPGFAPSTLHGEWANSFDMVLVAPAPGDLSGKRWIAEAVTRTAYALAPDGIAFYCLPRHLRGTALRIAASTGLTLKSAVLHGPNLATSRFLVPLNGSVLRYAALNLSAGPEWKRRLVRAAAVPGFSKIMQHIAPRVGLLLQLRGARPPAEWAFRLAQQVHHGPVVVQVNWRQPPNGAVVHCFPPDGADPAFVVKLAWNRERADALAREAEALRVVADTARSSGAQIPATLHLGDVNSGTVLVQGAVRGQIAAGVLRGSPARFGALLEQLTRWLAALGRSTLTEGTLDRDFQERNLLQPLAAISPSLREPTSYHGLISRARTLEGSVLPRVATHNDLTMWNVLLESGGGMGIVDWEAAHPYGVPMVDFYYAATDAAAAATGYGDRLAALRSCFTASGELRRVVEPLEHSLQRAFGLSAALAAVCFNACWLHHAANEARAAPAGSKRPFLEIVQWLADTAGDVSLPVSR